MHRQANKHTKAASLKTCGLSRGAPFCLTTDGKAANARLVLVTYDAYSHRERFLVIRPRAPAPALTPAILVPNHVISREQESRPGNKEIFYA